MKWLTRAAVGILFLVLISKIYVGITTKPTEGDSLAYHIPIAQIIVNRDFGNKSEFKLPFYYYPAWGETILAGFIKLGIPLNLYNALAWGLLGGVSYILGKRRGLDRNLAIIFAAAVCLLNSVQRLILTQTVDIWLAVWFLWTVGIMEKKERSKSDYFWIGSTLGMLVGTKYSGLLLTAVVGVVYGRTWWRELGDKKKILFWGPLLVIGGWWYVRNWLVAGNPICPQAFLTWKGDEMFHLTDWAVWKTIFSYSEGWWIWIQAVISEYLVWGLAPAILVVSRSRMAILGILAMGVYLTLPSWPENTLSDLRYAIPAFSLLILAVFEWAKKKGREEEAAFVAVITMTAVLPQLDYIPKLLFGFLVVCLIWTGIRKKQT